MKLHRLALITALAALLTAVCCLLPGTAGADDEIVLRICNWEEYIDLGDWDEEKDVIDLEENEDFDPENWEDSEIFDLDHRTVFAKNAMTDDFEKWYEATTGKKVRVEYSTFGTNEDLYNMLTIGDVYDLVCPSDYMIMKLMAENQLVPLSEDFMNPENEQNYYQRGLSPYIREIFDSHKIGGEAWSDYAAGYMWGVTGFVYDPNIVSREEASSWKLLENRKYNRLLTIKDNVRDAYFAAIGAVKSDLLLSDEFRSRQDYAEALEKEMNDVSPESIEKVQSYLQKVRENVYSFETDAGKADIITGKIVANYQWSGDAVYAMNVAEGEEEDEDVEMSEDDRRILNFSVPDECTNIYFDGWVMLKCGIGNDAEKQAAAEAFINFVSRPDNAIRNMYYIGYTSAISGGEDERILSYLDWNYGAETDDEESGESEETEESEENEESEETEESEESEENEESEETEESEESEEPEESEENGENEEAEGPENGEEDEPTVDYDVSYFFLGMGQHSDDYVLTVPESSLDRQLAAQYPTEEVIRRACIMVYFDDEQNEQINKMWTNVRCFNIRQVPAWVWIVLAAVITGGTAFWLCRRIARNRQHE